MAKYRTKYVGGPLDGLYWETDDINDFGTTWSCMDAKDGSGRYYIWATRDQPTLDSVWEPAGRIWELPDDVEVDPQVLDDHVRRLLDGQQG